MFDWLFKKKLRSADAAPLPPVSSGRPAPVKTVPVAPAEPAPVAVQVDWAARLQGAQGDDAALLALACTAAMPVDQRLAAVAALQGESALKQAERDLRKHDRRVHRAAKQRHQQQLAQRQARTEADRLIAAVQALAATPDQALSRAIELDRAWQALDTTLLLETQRSSFADASAHLAHLMRAQADQEQQHKRWLARAGQAAAALQAACLQAAEGGDADAAARLAAALAEARTVADAAPAGQALPALGQALDEARQLEQRLAALAALLAPGQAAAPESPAPPAEADDPTPAVAADATTGPGVDPGAAWRAWQQLPPLADARLQAVLQARVDRWQQAQDQARQARHAEQRAQVRAQSRERQRLALDERLTAATAALDRAESALAEGHPAQAHQHLVAVDDALHGAEAPDPLRQRIAATQAQVAELRGWQHWAGGRARDDLLHEAEALAAATAPVAAAPTEAGADPAAPADPATPAAPPDEAAAVPPKPRKGDKLSIKQRVELIDSLRERWKELDRLGGAGGRALWQRFDAALKTAYEPVAAHAAAQRAAREHNLATRLQLIEALDAVPLPEAGGGDADARPLVSALDQFHAEWRKLGPIEHTVPRPSRDMLAARLRDAVQRLETPLDAARTGARAARQQLVDRAQALAQQAAADPQQRALVDEARQLQADWQQQAKALPLGRGDEKALWSAFRGALDAVFAAREAAFQARDAEFQAHAHERLALIEGLEALVEGPAPALKRALAEAQQAWQRIGPAPRSEAAALERRYDAACAQVQAWLARSDEREWLLRCDAVEAKLALCHAVDDGRPADTLAEPWAALPSLPARWEQALRQRAGLAPAAAEAEPAPGTDELLLQLEAAWNLPSPPAFEAARRELKLQALKSALESGRNTAAPQRSADEWLAAALGRAGLQADQRERLQAVLSALRRRGPGRG